MIIFSCSICSKKLQVKDELADKKAKCPLCGKVVPIPSAQVPNPMPASMRIETGESSLLPSRSPGMEGPIAQAPRQQADSAGPEAPLPTLAERRPAVNDPGQATESGMVSGPTTSFPTPTVGFQLAASSFGQSPSREYDFLAPPRGPGEMGRLGPYRILKELGAGGMGVVFQAEDPHLKRLVAIKVLLPELASNPQAKHRFLREAQATAAIDHDHIVTIFQVGEDRGVPFLAMPLLKGEPLDQRLKREKKLPQADLLRIGREIAEGLDAAHEHGLIHRDIKPENIWLEGQRGRVKILDFGLVRVTAEDSHLTCTGMIMGTPAFMAPEQARGVPVDHRADLFSLGCVLYRMATGQLPFKGPDMLAVLMALVSENPRPIREINPGLASALSSLVTQLLAKNPKDRPPSARAVAEAIAAIEMEQAGAFQSKTALLEPLVEPKSESEDILGIGDGEPGIEGWALEEPKSPAPAHEEQAPLSPLDEEALRETEELTGKVLGRYEIDSLIGPGHHGTVFRAHDLKKDCVVALKIMPPGFPQNDAEMQHFIQSMKTMLPMRHPNIVRVHGAGKTGGYCWIALEFVEGPNLAHLIERTAPEGKKVNWRRAFRIAFHMGRALDFAHQNHLVHGNITPWNILWQSSEKTAKLNDLMFMKALEGSYLRDITREVQRQAELPYLAPEQIQGDSNADDGSDIYSLGVVVYTLLTGRPPFGGGSPKEMREQIRKGTPAKPTKFQPSIPGEFEWLVMTMLSWDRKYRIQTPTDLLVYLERIAEEEGLKV